MEPVSAMTAVLAMTQTFRRAFDSTTITSEEHRRLLVDYSLCMDILQESMGTVQALPESTWTQVIFSAARECAVLGKELAARQERLKSTGGSSARSRIAFALAPWDKLRAWHKEFRDSVKTVHSLTQDLLLRKLLEDQAHLLRSADKQSAFGDEIRHVLNRRGMRFHSGANRDDNESTFSTKSSFTVGSGSLTDVVTLADQVVSRSVTRGVQFDNDASLVIGTITVTHEEKPSDVNFIPATLVEKCGLTSMLEALEGEDVEDNVFVGLNNQEFRVSHTLTLQWCASTMHRVRTTRFHVAEEVPFDMILGNPFIKANGVFDPQRVALPLRRKRHTKAKQEEEDTTAKAHELAAAEELQRTRNEDARKRALEKEARRIAKSQTSASSMLSSPLSALTLNNGLHIQTPVSTSSAASPTNASSLRSPSISTVAASSLDATGGEESSQVDCSGK